MAERTTRRHRTLAGIGALLMAWSVIAAPEALPEAEPIEEPSDLTAYATFGDAAPVQLFVDHQTRFVPLGPSIAHTQTEVSMPSAASGIAWLVDGGIANGLHGTTTGAKVPTEAAALQPGGEPESEFLIAGGPIGDPSFAQARAGRASAKAAREGDPTGYANAMLGEFVVLPAAGGPTDSPGTFDPGGEDGPDAAPAGRMAMLAIGSISSTSRSVREGSTVSSVSVAELKEINIGNRTSDNRCANCIRIDSMRVEAYAESNGSEGGARGAYRVTLGRACRRAFNAESGVEEDRCLPLNPQDPEGKKGLQSVDQLEAVNELFAEPIWTQIPGSGVDYLIGIRINAGNEHTSDSRGSRPSSPPDDARRNYAYPADAKRDRDQGQVARAVAEGPDVEIWTITLTQGYDDANARLRATPANEALRAIDEDDETPGLQITAPGPARNAVGTQTIPVETIRSVRRLHLTLGVARASATARPGGAALIGGPSGGDTTGGAPATALPSAPSGETVTPSTGETDGAGGAAGLSGPLSLRINWSSFRVKPWAPDDMAKGFGIGAIGLGALVMLRRRLGL